MNVHSLSFLLLILLTVLLVQATALCSAQEDPPTTTTLIETTTYPTSTKNSTETTATTLATATATSSIATTTTTMATTTPNATRHRMSYEDWQLLIRSWDFLRGVQRVAFDMCYDEFFNECQPAMQDSVQSVFLQWNKENYRCAPSWCACYDGYIRVLGNTTYCLFPAITGGIVQVCHELEICKPIRLRCADDFIYLQKQLPTRCDSFLNCTLKKEVIQASVGQCDSDWAQCNTELTCQVQRDPLNKLPPPPTPAPFAWTSDLPKALRDIWIVTAAIFGLVLAVAIGAVFLMRRRQRQWQQWYEEANEMAMERAEDVVWFEPEKEENNDNNSKKGDSSDTSSSNAKKDQDDPSASAPVAHRPQNLSCIRCGAENAPIQLLPCRCRWCGCAEKKTSGNTNDGNTETSSSSYNPPVAPASPTDDHSRGLLSSNDETHQNSEEKESTVEIASLSCRGVPKFTRNVPKTVMEQFEEREREMQRRETAAQQDNLENDNNNDGGSSTTRRRQLQQQQQSSAAAKPPRPKCDRCNRVVNFAINFDCLYYPAASQDVSEDGGKDQEEEEEKEKEIDVAAAVINMSPRETSVEEQEENNHQKENSCDEKDTSSSSRVSSPLTAAAVSSISSSEKSKKKNKKKVPTCCICLSEPCSVAIIPCGHVAQCVQCAKKLCVPVARADTERRTFVISSKCPLCREDIVAMASLSKSQNQKAFDKSASAMGE